MNLSGEKLCKGLFPDKFAIYINYTRSLTFETKPNYVYLRKLFCCLFRSIGFKYNNIFDWTERRFNKIYSEVK